MYTFYNPPPPFPPFLLIWSIVGFYHLFDDCIFTSYSQRGKRQKLNFKKITPQPISNYLNTD